MGLHHVVEPLGQIDRDLLLVLGRTADLLSLVGIVQNGLSSGKNILTFASVIRLGQLVPERLRVPRNEVEIVSEIVAENSMKDL